MIGVSDKAWLVDLISSSKLHGIEKFMENPRSLDQNFYSAYFGLGHQLKLLDNFGVFKVSLAGMAFGSYLLKGLTQGEINNSILDLGTGSGVFALLLRSLGANDIVASDVSEKAVITAAENEILNFETRRINFLISDLFANLPDGRYETIIFNPPGWRTPSDEFLNGINSEDNAGMALETMFYGDNLLLSFLKYLPERLSRSGRAIIGLNSLVGISDVLDKYKSNCEDGVLLQFRLIERHSLPLLFYSQCWKNAESLLRQEFMRWKDQHGAAYTVDAHGRIYWSYEIVECRHM